MPARAARTPNPVKSTALLRNLAAALLAGLCAVLSTPSASAAASTPRPPRPPVRILKVLPHFLDKEGLHTVNPSLFDRDAYQFELRQNPALRGGMRFDILWKARAGRPGAFTLKLELRGSKAPEQAPVILTSRAFARGGFSQWTRIPIRGRDYEALGELLAWRVTLWRDEELLGEQKSFLW